MFIHTHARELMTDTKCIKWFGIGIVGSISLGFIGSLIRKTIKANKKDDAIEKINIDTLDEIKQTYVEYIKDKDKYVFTLCNGTSNELNSARWIMVLQRLTKSNQIIESKSHNFSFDTTNNYDENDLEHYLNRTYCHPKLRIVDIFSADYPSIKSHTIETISEEHHKYSIGDVIDSSNCVDLNSNNSNESIGVQYFCDITRAYYQGLPHSNYTGKWINYTYGGYIHSSGYYQNGNRHGVWTWWFLKYGNDTTPNPQKLVQHRTITYDHGRQRGEVIEYHDDTDKKSLKYTLYDSVKVGRYTSWYHDGTIHIDGLYDHSEQKVGKWIIKRAFD